MSETPKSQPAPATATGLAVVPPKPKKRTLEEKALAFVALFEGDPRLDGDAIALKDEILGATQEYDKAIAAIAKAEIDCDILQSVQDVARRSEEFGLEERIQNLVQHLEGAREEEKEVMVQIRNLEELVGIDSDEASDSNPKERLVDIADEIEDGDLVAEARVEVADILDDLALSGPEQLLRQRAAELCSVIRTAKGDLDFSSMRTAVSMVQ